MRKITREAGAAFLARRAFKSGNTKTDGTTLYLHGNAIARWINADTYEVTLAGWPSATTRERLNYLPGVSAYQRKGEQILNGGKWGSREWIIITSANRNRGDIR